MELLILSFALVALLALNAFFVLSEFAIVKVRPSRVTELAAVGHKRALLLTDIEAHLDEYLSVCQVGITLASVALGMVGERTAAVMMGEAAGGSARYVVAIAVSYVLISGSHILLGELVPKSIAIRVADRAALACALPLRFFHLLFFPALWLLTMLANGILRLLHFGRPQSGEQPSEGELRILLDQSQERGMMSFRRLLIMENVFDLGVLTARDAMRPRAQVTTLDARRPWSENRSVIRSAQLSRYPLVESDAGRPTRFVHLKDLLLGAADVAPDLRAMARPLLTTTQSTPLEALLSIMQRRRVHMALVTDRSGEWTGLVTLEDVMEELVGTIRDEFGAAEPMSLADALTVERIHLEVEGESPVAAVAAALGRMRPEAIPLAAAQLLAAIEARERLVSTYLGHGIGMPHARIDGLARPFLMLLRSTRGVGYAGTSERGRLLFVLLTPSGQPHVHQRLQSTIAALLHESEYVRERLLTASSAEELLDVIRTGEQTAVG
ncbi:MAG: DUF21 domain-containing protein [Deltaproteobacteria bacterium]|nr:DUF21 domain-containing protein [Deltaproteobacteria bacterium]